MGNDITLWAELHRAAHCMRRQFALRRFRLEPCVHPLARKFGECDGETGVATIRIRVHRLGRGRRPLSRRTILHTLAHELAHLRHFAHGPAHAALAREIFTALS